MTPQESRPIEKRLREFLQRELGPFEGVRFCGWDHAESNVWEVSANGKRYYLKRHTQPRKFRQEVYAYQNWTPSLSNVTELIAFRERLNALLISAVPGVLVQEAALTERQEREAYRQAGAFLRMLHDVPFDDADALPLAEALLMRSESWLKRARGLVDQETMDWVRVQLEDAVNVIKQKGWTRVPCHRDYTARNWLLDSEDFYVIDFEHAKPDLWFADIERLWSGVWQRRPDLKTSFFSGYGRALTSEEEHVLAKLAAHTALTTIIWAREHGDVAFEQQGREVLERFGQAGA